MKTLYVQGAYGRAYTTFEQVVRDWDAGKDFKIIDGPYCSKRDLTDIKSMGYVRICFMSRTGNTLHILDLSTAAVSPEPKPTLTVRLQVCTLTDKSKTYNVVICDAHDVANIQLISLDAQDSGHAERLIATLEQCGAKRLNDEEKDESDD